jgi:hypothetical protein
MSAVVAIIMVASLAIAMHKVMALRRVRKKTSSSIWMCRLWFVSRCAVVVVVLKIVVKLGSMNICASIYLSEML